MSKHVSIPRLLNPSIFIMDQTYFSLSSLEGLFLGSSSGNALQTLNYAYNIRSWLTNINDVSGFSDDIVEMTKKKTLNLQDDKNIGWHIKTQRFGTLNDGGSDMGQHCKKR